ncbi:MAG: hypothetical protein QOK45_130 [Mycobacterium sp.]|nr:hypothetical protein [Mycobacterium sp.]
MEASDQLTGKPTAGAADRDTAVLEMSSLARPRTQPVYAGHTVAVPGCFGTTRSDLLGVRALLERDSLYPRLAG